jgi:hypothetical protein
MLRCASHQRLLSHPLVNADAAVQHHAVPSGHEEVVSSAFARARLGQVEGRDDCLQLNDYARTIGKPCDGPVRAMRAEKRVEAVKGADLTRQAHARIGREGSCAAWTCSETQGYGAERRIAVTDSTSVAAAEVEADGDLRATRVNARGGRAKEGC